MTEGICKGQKPRECPQERQQEAMFNQEGPRAGEGNAPGREGDAPGRKRGRGKGCPHRKQPKSVRIVMRAMSRGQEEAEEKEEEVGRVGQGRLEEGLEEGLEGLEEGCSWQP